MKFRARKVNGVWAVVIGKKVEFASEEKFGTLWECVSFCNEMNRQLEENGKRLNPNQMELGL